MCTRNHLQVLGPGSEDMSKDAAAADATAAEGQSTPEESHGRRKGTLVDMTSLLDVQDWNDVILLWFLRDALESCMPCFLLPYTLSMCS